MCIAGKGPKPNEESRSSLDGLLTSKIQEGKNISANA
jgi:hypothetical protein